MITSSNSYNITENIVICGIDRCRSATGELPGDIIYDGFLGSGTTLIAAEKTDRICYGTELTPGYCDTIVERYIRYSGNKHVIVNGAAIRICKTGIDMACYGHELLPEMLFLSGLPNTQDFN